MTHHDLEGELADRHLGGLGVPIHGAATIVSLVLPLLALVLYAAIAVIDAITSQGWADARPVAGSRGAGK
jgi:hypothetical protein